MHDLQDRDTMVEEQLWIIKKIDKEYLVVVNKNEYVSCSREQAESETPERWWRKDNQQCFG